MNVFEASLSRWIIWSSGFLQARTSNVMDFPFFVTLMTPVPPALSGLDFLFPNTKPRAIFSPGHEPVKFQNNYRQVQGRSQYYFEEVPVRDLPATFPTRTGKAVDPTGFEPAPWNMTGSCAADYTTGPETHPNVRSASYASSFITGDDGFPIRNSRNRSSLAGRTYKILSVIE